MKNSITPGVWPTMVTPFTGENTIDYNGLERMIEWYLENGVDGLFAVCQSSEMFFLSLEERLSLARFVKERAGGRIPVIASGHVSASMAGQIEEVKAMAATGVDAVVLVSNRLALQDEAEEVWKKNAEKLMEAVPDISFGIYECPFPYKRLLSPQLLKWCAGTGRFSFLKDTSCDLDDMKAKQEAVEGTGLSIFNANAATLLVSLRLGIAGYSGVMANFHPGLYVWLTRNWRQEPGKAERLQNFLGLASVIERQAYPVNAKYYLGLEGLGIQLGSRTRNPLDLTAAGKLEVTQLHALSAQYEREYTL